MYGISRFPKGPYPYAMTSYGVRMPVYVEADYSSDSSDEDTPPPRRRPSRPPVYNDNHFPTGGRPLGVFHRAAQAENIILHHRPGGCYRRGRCEQMHVRLVIKQCQRRGIRGSQGYNPRQLLRISRGSPPGAPDPLPAPEGQQAGGQQQQQPQQQQQLQQPQQPQLGPAPSRASSVAGGMVGGGGGYPMGMMGGGGFADEPRGGLGRRSRFGGGGGMRGMPHGGAMVSRWSGGDFPEEGEDFAFEGGFGRERY